MKELTQYFEQINLPAESALLNLIKNDQELKTKLVDGATAIVVGTEKEFIIAKGLTKIFPNIKIIVIERNSQAQAWAENNLSKEESGIELVIEEVGGSKSHNEETSAGELVVVKHMLHLVKDKNNMLQQLMSLLKANGKLIISVPYFFQGRTNEAIQEFGLRGEKLELGKGLGKSVVWKLAN